MRIFSIFTVLIAQCFFGAQAECNVCQANGVACVNSTSFYFCFGSTIPNYEILYHCKSGFDCTDLNAICVQSTASRPPSCGSTALCGLCSAHRNHMFACTSRSTFRFCYGALHPQSDLGYCPENFVCDASSDSVCVHPDKAQSVTCDVVDSPSATTTASTVTTAGPVTPKDVCDAKQVVGVYPIPGDTSCLEYIRCFRKDGLIVGALEPCPAGSWFSAKWTSCVMAKPDNCL